MSRPRINPPYGCAETIKQLASEGFELLGIAEKLGCHVETLKEWMKENPKFQYALECGREIERQALHKIVFDAAKANTAANSNARFLLRSKHNYVEEPDTKNASPNVEPQCVMIVKDHGTLEEWSAKCAAQQRALIESDITSSKQTEPKPVQVDAVALPEPPAMSEPAPVPASPTAPEAPAWVPVQQTPAPNPYGPPVFPWQALQAEPLPIRQTEPTSVGNPARPCPQVEAPVWRRKA